MENFNNNTTPADLFSEFIDFDQAEQQPSQPNGPAQQQQAPEDLFNFSMPSHDIEDLNNLLTDFDQAQQQQAPAAPPSQLPDPAQQQAPAAPSYPPPFDFSRPQPHSRFQQHRLQQHHLQQQQQQATTTAPPSSYPGPSSGNGMMPPPQRSTIMSATTQGYGNSYAAQQMNVYAGPTTQQMGGFAGPTQQMGGYPGPVRQSEMQLVGAQGSGNSYAAQRMGGFAGPVQRAPMQMGGAQRMGGFAGPVQQRPMQLAGAQRMGGYPGPVQRSPMQLAGAQRMGGPSGGQPAAPHPNANQSSSDLNHAQILSELQNLPAAVFMTTAFLEMTRNNDNSFSLVIEGYRKGSGVSFAQLTQRTNFGLRKTGRKDMHAYNSDNSNYQLNEFANVEHGPIPRRTVFGGRMVTAVLKSINLQTVRLLLGRKNLRYNGLMQLNIHGIQPSDLLREEYPPHSGVRDWGFTLSRCMVDEHALDPTGMLIPTPYENAYAIAEAEYAQRTAPAAVAPPAPAVSLPPQRIPAPRPDYAGQSEVERQESAVTSFQGGNDSQAAAAREAGPSSDHEQTETISVPQGAATSDRPVSSSQTDALSGEDNGNADPELARLSELFGESESEPAPLPQSALSLPRPMPPRPSAKRTASEAGLPTAPPSPKRPNLTAAPSAAPSSADDSTPPKKARKFLPQGQALTIHNVRSFCERNCKRHKSDDIKYTKATIQDFLKRGPQNWHQGIWGKKFDLDDLEGRLSDLFRAGEFLRYERKAGEEYFSQIASNGSAGSSTVTSYHAVSIPTPSLPVALSKTAGPPKSISPPSVPGMTITPSRTGTTASNPVEIDAPPRPPMKGIPTTANLRERWGIPDPSLPEKPHVYTAEEIASMNDNDIPWPHAQEASSSTLPAAAATLPPPPAKAQKKARQQTFAAEKAKNSPTQKARGENIYNDERIQLDSDSELELAQRWAKAHARREEIHAQLDEIKKREEAKNAASSSSAVQLATKLAADEKAAGIASSAEQEKAARLKVIEARLASCAARVRARASSVARREEHNWIDLGGNDEEDAEFEEEEEFVFNDVETSDPVEDEVQTTGGGIAAAAPPLGELYESSVVGSSDHELQDEHKVQCDSGVEFEDDMQIDFEDDMQIEDDVDMPEVTEAANERSTINDELLDMPDVNEAANERSAINDELFDMPEVTEAANERSTINDELLDMPEVTEAANERSTVNNELSDEADDEDDGEDDFDETEAKYDNPRAGEEMEDEDDGEDDFDEMEAKYDNPRTGEEMEDLDGDEDGEDLATQMQAAFDDEP